MSIATQWEEIRKNINKSIENAPLAMQSPRVMGVTKGKGRTEIQEAIRLGITCFGENRVQEAYDKWPDIKNAHSNLELHMIGPLQTNKVRQALELFDVIQTLDRPRLAEEIAKVTSYGLQVTGNNTHNSQLVTRNFYIQINTGEEPQKSGVSPKDADGFIHYCRDDLKLPVVGLMCIPPADDVPAPHFALLREIAKRNNLHELSMGMSDDYEVAVRMGSTCVRLGRALFGERIS